MGKNKLRRFKENLTFSSLIQPTFDELYNGEHALKGEWGAQHFKNDNPIVLELGCGRGEYTVALASLYPNKNFIGVDIKGARLWRGARTVEEESIKNAAFARLRIEFIESMFGENEISEIWITFPDPFVKRAKKRLLSSLFLSKYQNILKDGGIVHLKTDSGYLYHYTVALLEQNGVEIVEATEDLYRESGKNHNVLSIKTTYEALFSSKGIPIKYITFKLPRAVKLVEPIWDEERFLDHSS